ncbi:hypothetical protein JKP88DRAFT_223908 [Tribonema minus]|uniref:Senescence domain-containing protein n=1 Tax=Tribonema minus TaxID=303371 RepID=A0A835YQZ9_9STRA|nr:hypothetical protein JKP88DRAFT_223908 [Tribonema minus]
MGPIEEDFIRCGTGEGMAYMEDPLPAEYSDAQEEEEPHATGHAHTHQAFQHLGAGAVGADVIEDADDDVKTHQIFGKVRSDSSDGAPAPGTGGAQEPTPDEEGDGQQQEQQLQGPHTIAGAIFDTVKELVVEVGAQMGRDADWLASLLPAEVQKPLRSAASLVSRHVRTVATPVVEQATRHGAKLISAGAKVTGTVRDRVGPKGKEAFDAARRGARGLVKKAQAFGKTGDGKGKTAEQESETKEDSEGTGGQ